MPRARSFGQVPFDNELVRDLLAMKKAGEFREVWINDGKISILGNDQYVGVEKPRRVGTKQVRELIDEWKRRSTFVRSH